MAAARARATAGDHAEAVAMLRRTLDATPGDTDARVLLGTVLSWQGKYDEARAALALVLAEQPRHGDALAAMINIEHWSGNHDRALALLTRALSERPDDPALLIAHARVLLALKHTSLALDAIERVLANDPMHAQALLVRQSIRDAGRLWRVETAATHDGFDDGRAPWREARLSVGRDTVVGPVRVSMARAARFGMRDQQVELEAYPAVSRRTHGYVGVAYSPRAGLYPAYRLAADLTQTLGSGFQVTAGYRRLGFEPGINLYVASVSKYTGNWLLMGRAFVMPRGHGAPVSYQGSVRRYFGDVAFVGVGAIHGGPGDVRSINDIEIVGADALTGETRLLLWRRLEWGATASFGRDTRAGQRAVRRYSVGTALAVRF